MKLIQDQTRLEEAIKKYDLERIFEDISALSGYIRLISFSKNTFIYSSEAHLKYAYYLIEGSISLHANAVNGNSKLIKFCEAPVFIGDMEIMGYHEESNTIRTINECVFIGIEMYKLKEVIKSDIKFSNFICKTIAGKMYYFSNQQMSNKMNTAYENIASYILNLSDERNFFVENLKNLSELMGISYRHLLRVLKRLSEGNLIRKSGRGYEVIDKESLKELANGNLLVIPDKLLK